MDQKWELSKNPDESEQRNGFQEKINSLSGHVYAYMISLVLPIKHLSQADTTRRSHGKNMMKFENGALLIRMNQNNKIVMKSRKRLAFNHLDRAISKSIWLFALAEVFYAFRSENVENKWLPSRRQDSFHFSPSTHKCN